MKKFCKQCCLDLWKDYAEDLSLIEDDIVMGNDDVVCDGCGRVGPYVHHLGKDISCEEYDNVLNRVTEIYANLTNP